MEYFKERFVTELNDQGAIEIAGNVWTRHEVLETMDAQAAKNVFENWVNDSKQAAKDRTREFLIQSNCLDRFQTLTHRMRQGNVLPFIGAGMSHASGFPLWAEFLQSLVADSQQLSDRVNALLNQGAYEEAAQVVAEARGPGVLAEEIHNRFGSHRREARGPVQLMPSVFSAEVITTNFDYVLPTVYDEAERPFSAVFCGSELRTAPRRIGNNPHCLLRLHGQGDDDQGRVLTRSEYDHTYTEGRTLSGVLSAITGTHSLLFMGCSLGQDRTVAALRDLRQNAQADPPRHYAFLPLPAADEREQRRQFLAEAEIYPIYYPAPDHDQCIEDMLVTLMEGGLE